MKGEKLRGLKGTKAELEISDLKSAVIPRDKPGIPYRLYRGWVRNCLIGYCFFFPFKVTEYHYCKIVNI